MLKVLLVDDEPFIIQGLKVLIDWENEEFEIAGTASNGKEADVYKRQMYQIIPNLHCIAAFKRHDDLHGSMPVNGIIFCFRIYKKLYIAVFFIFYCLMYSIQIFNHIYLSPYG